MQAWREGGSVWSLTRGPWPTTEDLALFIISHWVPNGFITSVEALYDIFTSMGTLYQCYGRPFIHYNFISYHCYGASLYGFNSLTLTSSALLLTRTERHSAIFQEYPGFLIHWHTTSHKQLSNAYETKNWRKQSIKAERITSQKTLILNFRRTT